MTAEQTVEEARAFANGPHLGKSAYRELAPAEFARSSKPGGILADRLREAFVAGSEWERDHTGERDLERTIADLGDELRVAREGREAAVEVMNQHNCGEQAERAYARAERAESNLRVHGELCGAEHPITGWRCSRPAGSGHTHVCDLPPVQGEPSEHFHIWSELPCKPGQCRMTPQGEPTESHPDAVYSPEVFERMHALLTEASGSPTHALRLAVSRQLPQSEPSDAQVRAAARTLNTNGWTCDGGNDEPDNYDQCEDCQRCCDGLARAVLRAAAAATEGGEQHGNA